MNKALELAFPSDAERCFFTLRSSLFVLHSSLFTLRSSLFVLHSSLNLLPCSQQLHGALNYLIGLVPNLEVLAHIPDISRYKGFQLQGEVFLRLS